MDETGFAMGFALSAKVVVLRGNIINFKTIDGNREWVSQINAIGMHGQTIPPFIIFKGKQHTESLWQSAEEAVGECTIGMSDNGWSNHEMGIQWLKHFERYTRRTEAWETFKKDNENVEYHGYRLLIMDGHSSHVNIDFIELCWRHKIVPICLPPHSTHFLQPLDLVLFSVLKRLYSRKVDEYGARGITGINREYFLKILAAGLLPLNIDCVLKRLIKQPSSSRPSTPPSDEPTLLSSPLHPKTPKSYLDRARYAHTILYPETTPKAAESVVTKLMEHLQSLEDGLHLMQVENNDLRNNVTERRAKKKKKRVVLSTESVLTAEWARAIVAAKEAEMEAKGQAKAKREALKTTRQEAATIAKAQVEERKKARAAAAEAKKLSDQHRKLLGEADRAAKKAQKTVVTATNIANRKKTDEAREAVNKAAEEATLKAEALVVMRTQSEASSAAAATAAAHYKALQEAAKKAKEAIQEATRVEEAEDDELSELSDDEMSDEDIDVEMGDV